MNNTVSSVLPALLLMAGAILLADEAMAQAPVLCDVSNVCQKTIDSDSHMLAECRASERIKQTCEVPKHLRPAWAVHKTQGITHKGNNSTWTACYIDDAHPDHSQDFCMCGWFEGGQWKRPSFGDFTFPKVDFTSGNCLNQYNEAARMPMCGSEFYDYELQCALVHFLNNSDETTLDEDEHNTVLVILDGCALCEDESRITGALIQFRQTSGSLFTTCPANLKQVPLFGRYKDAMGRDKEHAGTAGIQIEASDNVDTGTTSFTFPFVLYHRICNGVFTTDRPPQFYAEPKLIIKHTCGGKKRELVMDLPEIDTTQGRIFEMRGLELNLNRNAVAQWRSETKAGGTYARLGSPKWWNKYGLPVAKQNRRVQMDPYA